MRDPTGIISLRTHLPVLLADHDLRLRRSRRKSTSSPWPADRSWAPSRLTEPSAGTDASMQKSAAVLDGDHRPQRQQRCSSQRRGAADVFIVFAMTDKELGTRGITAFILERDMPGFTMGKPENKMGLRAFFDLRAGVR